MSETTYTESNPNPIHPMSLDEAIKLLDDTLQKKRNTEEQMPQLIANLAGSVGWKVYGMKYLPKGTVFIGTGISDGPFPTVESATSLPSETK